MPVGQKVNDLVRLQINHDCPKRSATPTCEVIQDVVIPRCTASRASSVPQVANPIVCRVSLKRVVRHLRPWGHQVRKSFAIGGVTKEFAHAQDQSNALSRTGQAFDPPTIAAVQTSRRLLT